MVLKNFLKIALVCMSIFVIACENIEEESSSLAVEESTQRLNVLATTPMLAEYVRQVGSDNIDLNILMPYSADPHSFEASPIDAKKIADADLVFLVLKC